LILERVANVEVSFADNCDDGRISDIQLLGRAGVKRESRTRPTENRFTN
jgi:hypothetical protein